MKYLKLLENKTEISDYQVDKNKEIEQSKYTIEDLFIYKYGEYKSELLKKNERSSIKKYFFMYKQSNVYQVYTTKKFILQLIKSDDYYYICMNNNYYICDQLNELKKFLYLVNIDYLKLS